MATYNWNQLRKQAEEAGESTEGFTPLPVGTYEVKVTKADVKSFKGGEKEGWNLTFVVENGPEAGRRCFTNLVISPESAKAIAILLRQLEALGVKAVLDAGGTLQQVAAAMLNQTATIDVDVRTYNEKLVNDVKSIKARVGDPLAGGGAVQTPTGLPI